MKGFARLTVIGGIFLTLMLVFAPQARAQGMGAFYWGDADGNGDIGTPDVSSLNAILNNPAASDTVYYTKYPVSRYRQDTDGNGDIGAPDAAILRAWLYGDFSTISGGAGTLILEANTLSVASGASVVVGAHGISASGSGAVRTGFGVEFSVLATGCTAATIYGYTVTGGDTTAGYGWWKNAYKYTPQPFAPDFAKAWVKVRPNTCAGGSVIRIRVFIPSDAHAVIPGARFPNDLDAAVLNITVSGGVTLVSLAITPNPITIAELGTQQVRVVGTLSDSSTANCTTSCVGKATTYTSVTGNITVSATGLVTGTAVLKCAGGSGTFTATNGTIVSPVDNVTVTNDETVSSVAILPITATIAELATVQLNALATLNDGSTNACNTGCCGVTTTWTPVGSCSVSAAGLVTGSAVLGCAGGSCTVTATANTHVSNVSTITITNDDTISTVVVTPNPGSVLVAGTLQMHAMGNVSDGATADCTVNCCGLPTAWVSGNVGRFTVGAATGLITGVSNGTTIVTATNNTHAGTATIIVSSTPTLASLAITPNPITIAEAGTQQVRVVGTLTDSSTVNCTTSCVGHATTYTSVTGPITVSATGLVTGTAVTKCVKGAGSFTATNNLIVSPVDNVTVNNTETVSTVAILPAAATIAELATVQLNALATLSDGSTAACNTGCCALATTWTPTGNCTVAAGLVTGSAVLKCAGGSCTVTATNNAHVSNVSTITVNNDETVSTMAILPITATIAELGTVQINATATLSDGSTNACNTGCCGVVTTWTPTGSVTVAAGLVTGSAVTKCAPGTGTVTATANAHVSNVSTITVTNTETVSTVAILPAAATIAELATTQLNALATLSDGSTAPCNATCCGNATTWTPVGNCTVAAGLVTGSAVLKCAGGSCTVTATNNAHVSNVSTITVNNDETVSTMAILPITATIAELATVQLNATATLSDGSTNACNTGCCGVVTTWTPVGNCTVSAAGLVTGSAVLKCAGGSCTVTATANAHVSNVSTITVTNDETVSTVAILPITATIAELGTTQLNATANLSDGSTNACNTGCCGVVTTWTPVGACSVVGGLVTGSAVTKCVNGTCTVTATINAHVSNVSTITVTNTETVSTVAILPAAATIAELATVQLNALATLSDGSTAACNTGCCALATTWTPVGNCTVAAGLVTGSAVLKCAGGSCTVTATNNAHVSNVSTITVNNDETVSTMAILPITATIAELGTVQINATATLSDGSTNACNTGCCAVVTTWTPVGNITVSAAGLVSGSTVKGCAGGSGTVTATANAHVSNVSTITITNDDTISTVVVTPNPGSVTIGGTLQMHAMGNVSDGGTADCTANCCGNATAWVSGNVGRFTVGAGTGLITGVSNGTTIVTATNNTHAGTATIVVGGIKKCVVGSWFPFNAAARIYNNAHSNQGVTLLYNNTASPTCNPTAVHITCTPTAGAPVLYTTCAGYPDANCSPTTAFAPLTSYGCTGTVTNAAGSTTLTVANLHTGTAAAPSTPAVGGIGGGYVGGDSYLRATGCVAGPVTLRFIDMDSLANVSGKVYVQIAQGATVTQAYAPAGTATVSLACLPITDLTAGLKCSSTRCDLNTQANNYNNYAYATWTSIDGKDMVLRMMLQPNSQGYINTYNTVHAGRYRADVFATIPYTNLSQFIYPLNRGAANSQITGGMFRKPTKLRAGLVLFGIRNVYTLTTLVSGLMEGGDSDSSIALCLASESNISLKVDVALPPLLVAPELVRAAWATPCSTFTVNAGVTQFHVWNWIPGQSLPLMVIGAYANASNFSPSILSGGLNLFVFPIYVGGVGYHQIPALVSWTAPTANTTIHAGNLGFEMDMRELWVQPDLLSPGWDPDTAVDKRIMVSIQPILPIDPARRDAGVGDASGWYVAGQHVPNSTDNQLITKWGTSYGLTIAADGASWDDRFLRNSAITATGAFTGYATGIAIFGLQLNGKIDDADFTTFEVGYMASVAIGSHGVRVGSSNWRYWSGAAHSERFGRELSFVPSNTTEAADDKIPWSSPCENGGPVNYAAMSVFLRGLTITTPKSTPIGTSGASTGENLGLHGSSGTYSETGISLKVQHVGPIQSWTTTIMSTTTSKAIFIERLLGMPEAISPTKDSYFYPAPQWGGTQGASTPANRNGELRKVFTYSTAPASTKWIQRGAYLTRRYLKFSVPGFVPAWAGHSPDMFLTTLSTVGQGKSAKGGVHDSDGTETTGTPNTLTDLDARFIEWGVATGDNLWLRRGGTGYGPFAISARTQTTVSFTGASFGNGRTYIKYHIARANPRGECLVDEWYGGGSYLRDGGGCNGDQLWQAIGPIPLGATSVTVTIPNITPGPATFNAVAGTVPDFWEGIPSDPRWNNAWYHPPKLDWGISILNINSASATQAGLGAKLDWNNMNFWATDFAIIHLGTDTVAAYLDIKN